jgi:hypothetical protein
MIKVFSETAVLEHHKELLKEFTKSLKDRKLMNIMTSVMLQLYLVLGKK